MSTVDGRAARLDVYVHPGNTASLVFTWPSVLTGRTFTAGAGATAAGGTYSVSPSVSVVGAVVTVTLTEAQTSALASGSLWWKLTETTGAVTQDLIVGKTVPNANGSGEARTSGVIDLSSADGVEVSVVGADSGAFFAYVDAETAARSAADTAEVTRADAAYRPKVVTLSDIPTSGVVYWSHRGARHLLPENTMEGYRAAIAMNRSRGVVPIIEIDVHALSDGSLVVMHDATVDRTTASSGNVADYNTPGWAALTNDTASWFGSTIFGNLSAPFLDDVLREFAHQAIFVLEIKSTAAATGMLATLETYDCADTVLVTSFTQSHLTTYTAAGYTTGLYIVGSTVASAPTAAALVAAGITYMALSVPVTGATTTAYLASCRAAGIKVGVATMNRHVERDAWSSTVDFLITDEPMYLPATPTVAPHRRTTDPYAMQTHYHGHLEDGGVDRGDFTTPDYHRLRQVSGDLFEVLGWACPLAATSYTLTATVRYDDVPADTTRWAGLLVSSVTDKCYIGTSGNFVDGYLCLLRGTGQLQIFRTSDAGNTSTQLGATSSTAIVDAQSVTVTIQVTATQLIFTRTDTGASVTVTDSTYRGRYLHFGKSGLLFASLKDVTIS